MTDLNLTTAAMALCGLLLHFLPSWSEFYKAIDTKNIGPIAYIKLDLPAWLASVVGAGAFYVAGEAIISPLIAEAKVEAFISLLAGYVGSSLAPKILGSFAARASIR